MKTIFVLVVLLYETSAFLGLGMHIFKDGVAKIANSTQSRQNIDLYDYQHDQFEPLDVNTASPLTNSEKLRLSNSFLQAYYRDSGSVYDLEPETIEEAEAAAEVEVDNPDCSPQDKNDLIAPDDYNANSIQINYINESQAVEEGQAQYSINKRNVNETNTDTENEFGSYDVYNSKKKKVQRTKKQKQEDYQKEAKIQANAKKPKSFDPKAEMKSDIKIIQKKSKKPVNTNPNVAINKKLEKKQKLKEKEMSEKQEITKELLPYLLQESDNFVPGIKTLDKKSKEDWKKYIFYDSKDATINWEDFDSHDKYDDDCDSLEKIKKFLENLSKTLEKTKREAIIEFVNILCHFNEGSHKGLQTLSKLVMISGEEGFLILKTILVLIHRLNEAGSNGIKSVLQSSINVENYVIHELADDCACKCDCPTKRGAIINNINQIFFRPYPSTTWKSDEIVQHLKEVFGIEANDDDCWCDCHCDERQNVIFQIYSIADVELGQSPYLYQVFSKAFTNNTKISAKSFETGLQQIEVKRRPRKGLTSQLEKRSPANVQDEESGTRNTTKYRVHVSRASRFRVPMSLNIMIFGNL